LGKSQSLDRQALVHTYEQYSPRLYCYAVRLLGDANLAEECVSETFCRYLHTLKAGRGPTISAQAYLYRIAHNWITDFFRQHPQTEPLEDDVPADAQDDSNGNRFAKL
jgi:RNA polymerase sigma-70 factor (ECF subfamily)